MNAYKNYNLFVQFNRLEVQIATMKAKHDDQDLIDIVQQEQDIVFISLNEETQREMLDLRRLRALENRLGMMPRQFCPYHDDRVEMTWTGEMSYTQDSTGKTTGAYRVIACPQCKNTEMEGVRV